MIEFIQSAASDTLRSDDRCDTEIDSNKFPVKWLKDEEMENDETILIPIPFKDPPAHSSPSYILNALNDD